MISRLLSSKLVNYFQLHPDRRQFEFDRVSNHFADSLAGDEAVHDINRTDCGDCVGQSPEALLAQHFLGARMHRDNALSMLLQKLSNAIRSAGAISAARQQPRRPRPRRRFTGPAW